MTVTEVGVQETDVAAPRRLFRCGKAHLGHNAAFRALFGDVGILTGGFSPCTGSTVARYSGDTVHRRFRDLEQYKNKNYEAGMRRAFLKTDEDLRSGK